MSKIDLDITNLPDTTVSVREVFGIDSDIRVPAYSKGDAYVPDLDPDYLFDRETTLAILETPHGIRTEGERDAHPRR